MTTGILIQGIIIYMELLQFSSKKVRKITANLNLEYYIHSAIKQVCVPDLFRLCRILIFLNRSINKI